MKPADTRRPSAPIAHYSLGDGGGHPHHYTPEEMHNVDVAHEAQDVNLPAIVWSAVAVAVVCITTAVLMYVLFWQFEAHAKARDPRLSPLAMPPTLMPKTTASPEFGSALEPRLLTNEPEKLRELRDREQKQLHEGGWADEKAGVARIPIDEAKKLMLERGLPVRPDPMTDPSLGTHRPAYGESSSGRTITRPPSVTEPPPAAPATTPAAPPHKGGQ